MSNSQKDLDFKSLRKAITEWLEPRLNAENYQWIIETGNKLGKGAEDWEFFSSFSAAPRHTGKDKLQLSDEEKEQANNMRAGWEPEFWSIDELGRTYLLLSIATFKKQDFIDKLEKLFISSDTREAIALYQSLPLLPYPEDLTDRAAEGIRSNITTMFNAVALRNPYAADYLDKSAWNQLVLKALFVESPLYKIQNIDSRNNEKLAKMLVDYAHERWAAGRSVSPELWRPVGPFAEGMMIDDLQKVLTDSDKLNQQAAILALKDSPSEDAVKLMDQNAAFKKEVKQQDINWHDIGEAYNKK